MASIIEDKTSAASDNVFERFSDEYGPEKVVYIYEPDVDCAASL